MSTVYFVRHGETEGNVTKLILHPDQDVLSKGGILEATLLGLHLEDVQFTKIYCSDYPRTVHTTEIVLKENKQNSGKLHVNKERLLREIDVGVREGKLYGTLLRDILAFLEKGLPYDEFVLPGAETLPEVKARAKTFLKSLLEDLDKEGVPQTVLVVSHGLLLRCMMDIIRSAEDLDVVNWDDEAGCGRIMKNATYMKLLIETPVKNEEFRRKVEFLSVHAHSHLDSIPGTDSLTRLVKTPEWAPLSGCFQV